MARLKPTTAELEAVKQHFAWQGYGIIRDETAAAQIDLIRLMRSGRYNAADYKPKEQGNGND